jgi:hypothetical protein
VDVNEQIAWLIANTSATNTIIRALGETAKDNAAFIDSVKRLYAHRMSMFLASAMRDPAIDEYEKALKDLLPAEVRAKVFP